MVALAGDVAWAWRALGWGEDDAGRARLRGLGTLERVVAVRFGPAHAALFPHGGPAMVRAVLDHLRGAGLTPAEREAPLDARAIYPEAADALEAGMLAALARAASPLAVDLLLDQPRRWAERAPDGDVAGRSRRLNRLIDPPLVAMLGRPNIGKSTLLNALAGRAAALVGDEAGTTRDHVGVTLDLAGLVVRYLDTPGIWVEGDARARAEDRAAVDLALAAARHADLLLLADDPTTPALEPARVGWPEAMPTLRVRLRADLGGGGAVLAVSVREGRGLTEFVAAVREALVPAADLAHAGVWRFW